jgi:hypothetical protein
MNYHLVNNIATAFPTTLTTLPTLELISPISIAAFDIA